MKLNRHNLRMLIESVVSENKFKSGEEVMTFKTQDLSLGNDILKTNKKARELQKEVAQKVYEFLSIKPRGRYYVYAQEDGTMSLGDVRYSKGDPYTYKALSGGFYRVMSGPDSNEKRKSGKRVGISPIGAKFKPSSPPQIKISAAMLELTWDGKGNGNPTVKTANGILTAKVEDDVQGTIKELKDYLGMGGSVAVNQMKSLSEEPFAFFGPQCGERGKNLAKFKAYIKAQNSGDRGVTNALDSIKTRKYKVSGGETPDAGEGNAANESFSRGALLRRRYSRY